YCSPAASSHTLYLYFSLFLHATAPTEIYTLSLHDALPIYAISHLTFCFEPFVAPTAANGTISGRAIKMDGTGIASARIEVLNLSTGEIRYAVTNPFGYYTFQEIETNDLYMVTVSHKRHQFANPQRMINFDGDLVDLDFVAF